MANNILTAFNDHFVEFITDVQTIFPDDRDVLIAKNSILAIRKANPTTLIHPSDSIFIPFEAAGNLTDYNERYTIGAYHPLTKHLNLVAEYNHVESKSQTNVDAKSRNVSLGAILFF